MTRGIALLGFIPFAIASCADLTCAARPCVTNAECADLADSCHVARCTAPKGSQKFGHCILDTPDSGCPSHPIPTAEKP